jgi:uncharacterized repeat protein (TIGR04138 family)
MPPSKQSQPAKSMDEVVEEVGLYPLEAYEFVQRGLSYAIQRIHGNVRDPKANRHVSGQQVCHGLRELALLQWGMLAKLVLQRWNVNATDDFGRIVFAMIAGGYMQKTDQDTFDDFRGVFDFAEAFEQGYRIECKS